MDFKTTEIILLKVCKSKNFSKNPDDYKDQINCLCAILDYSSDRVLNDLIETANSNCFSLESNFNQSLIDSSGGAGFDSKGQFQPRSLGDIDFSNWVKVNLFGVGEA